MTRVMVCIYIGLDECEIVNIFLLISFSIFLGAQKNHLIEMVLLSTHNI